MQEGNELRAGTIGIMATDTLYGLVAPAHDVRAVERVYELKRRDPRKSCIVLIDTVEQVSEFGVTLTDALRARLLEYWPGPVSIVLPAASDISPHIERGNRSIAFRLPKDERVRACIRAVGPLIAPSANPEGLPPASTIDEARAYFGDAVDVYIDGGVRTGPPSRIIVLDERGLISVVREG